jgi:hydrogenase expression/formation protein HypE
MNPLIPKPYCIKAVLFDFDGTLTKPGALDFARLKQTIGCPPKALILEFIQSLPTAARQKEAYDTLERFERIAAENSEPNAGAEDLVKYLRSKGIALGILTRNTMGSIERALQNFVTLTVSDFDLIITRETPVKLKPSPDGVLLAAHKLKVDVSQVLMLGDFIFDIQAGQGAGSVTAFIDNGVNSGADKIVSDFRVSHLKELKPIDRPLLV